MSEYQPANLENLFVKRAGKRMRVASCDPTGGNNDNVLIPSGETYLFADLQGPGIVTHFFCTIGNPNKRRPECGIGTEEFNVRKVVLNVYWDDETEPSIQAPLGDFFGMGHGITKSFASAPLQITPEDGRGFNCWFPMPFRRRARFTVKNECCSPLHFYFYVDYEQVDSLPENTLYFHALWNRECPTDGKLLVRLKFRKADDCTWSATRLTYQATDSMESYYKAKAAQPRKRGRGKSRRRPAKTAQSAPQ